MSSHRSLRSPLFPAFFVRTAFAITALILAGTSCRTRAAEVLARVGGSDVTVEEIRAHVETLGAAEREALSRNPALLSQFVRLYLTRQVVLREALAKKFDQQPAVKAQLDRAHEEALTDLYLDSVSQPPEGYPSDAEIQSAYDANKAAFEVSRQYRVAQVYIALKKGADKADEEKAKKRAEDVSKKLKAKGADFAAVARAESDDKQSASQGGEIGWLTEAQLLPGIRPTVISLAKDAISEPVRLDDGWHIMKLLETRAPSTRPLTEVREGIVAQLRASRARELRQAYMAKVLEQGAPAINELALSKVLAKGK